MKRIKVIYTGGTIGGDVRGHRLGMIVASDVSTRVFQDHFNQNLPSILKENIEFLDISTPVKKFSEQMTPMNWGEIAEKVYESILEEKADGVVIAHGTDTLPYTASALSFMLLGLKVPVVITGSNSPLVDPNSDAARNLRDAIFVACQGSFKGVFVVFSGRPNVPSTIHLGTRVRKIAFEGNCFESINTKPIGQIRDGLFDVLVPQTPSIKFLNQSLLQLISERNERTPFQLLNKVEENVAFFQIYPGFDPGWIKDAIQANVKGIILDLYNSGTGCTEGKYNLIDSIQLAKNRKIPIPVFGTSQHVGSVEMNIYGSSVTIKEAGVVPLQDMIKEAAITKLMVVLKQAEALPEVVRMMLTNCAGEIREKSS